MAEGMKNIIKVAYDSDYNINIFISNIVVLAVVFGLIIIVIIFYIVKKGNLFGNVQIDEAKLGTGSGEVIFRPNYIDRQIAYQIWVELATRKIGMEIDYDNDVILEIYNSWYEFFRISRELIKEVPVSKASRHSTRQITNISINILNLCLRPHLTRWQARFRKWYQVEASKDINQSKDPQEIQKKFPSYEKLTEDMRAVNKTLILYRNCMYQLAMGNDKQVRVPSDITEIL